MNASATCPPIRVRGRFLWRGDDRFFVKGVAYQVHSTIDPISDDRLAELRNDVLLFKELGLNTLFIYCIDNEKDHTQAMKLLQEAGIYVFTAVSTPSNSINRLAATESYNPDTMASYFKTVDIMASFPNTLGLLAANQVINNDATMPVAGILKAVVRDLKTYMKLQNKANGQRVLPIGYNATTSAARDQEVLEYLTAGDDEITIDFWTCTGYGLEEILSKNASGYDGVLHQFSSASVPIFLSEYGNISRQPRTFQATTTLFSPAMSRIFSGGCVYEFWQSANKYGLVEMLRNGSDKQITAYKSGPGNENKISEIRDTDRGTVLIFQDFVNYKSRLLEVGKIEVESVHEATKKEKEQKQNRMGASGLWQDEYLVTESCVDWEEISGIRSG